MILTETSEIDFVCLAKRRDAKRVIVAHLEYCHDQYVYPVFLEKMVQSKLSIATVIFVSGYLIVKRSEWIESVAIYKAVSVHATIARKSVITGRRHIDS